MDNRATRAAADRRNWHLMWGIIAGCALVALRLLGATVALGLDEGGGRLAFINVLEALVCASLVWGMYRHRLWAAIGLVVLWAAGFGYSWYASGTVVPPLALISLAIGAGLVVGTLAIAEMGSVARAGTDASTD